ncbi:MAG TPA: hypothetical protein VIJ51_13585 [Solirubrobacteraceae bacterium]
MTRNDRSRTTRTRVRQGVGLAALLGILLFGAASAQAAATISLTVGPDPTESIATQLGATGATASSNDRLFLAVLPTGAQACAANYEAETGESTVASPFENTPTYSETDNFTFDTAGSYILCGWLENETGSSPVIDAQASETIVVRLPHLSIAIAVPPTVQAGQVFQAVTTAQAETNRSLYVETVPNTGDGCPANDGAADSTPGDEGIVNQEVDGGPQAISENQSFSTAGSYLFCAYFEYPERQSPPEAVASAMTTVVAPPPPPPPCVVPTISLGAPVATAEQSLHAADCSVGAVSYAASHSVKRGGFIATNPSAGTSLAAGAAVKLVISNGPPCIVPAIVHSETLAGVKRKLAAAACALGRVIHPHTRAVKLGHLVGFLPASRTHLSPYSKVEVEISAGPPRRK